jgi:hypothetical protein
MRLDMVYKRVKNRSIKIGKGCIDLFIHGALPDLAEAIREIGVKLFI